MRNLNMAADYLKALYVFGTVTRNKAKADYTTVKRLSKTDNSAKKFTLLVIGCVLKGIQISKGDAKKYYQLCTTLGHRSDDVIAEKILAPFVKSYGPKIRAFADNPKKRKKENGDTHHFIQWEKIRRAVVDVFKYYDDAAVTPQYDGYPGLTPITQIDFHLYNENDGLELHGEIFPKLETGEMVIGYYDNRNIPETANATYETRVCSTHWQDVKRTLEQIVNEEPQSGDGFL